MNKKLRELLECRKSWLQDPEMRYDVQDFMADWKRYTHNIEESYHLELISYDVHKQCKETLMDYMQIFWKGEL